MRCAIAAVALFILLLKAVPSSAGGLPDGTGRPIAPHAVGICQPVRTLQTPPPASQQGDYVIEPAGEAQDYFSTYEHVKITSVTNASISAGPKNGSLIDGRNAVYVYLPNANYIGSDSATFLVTLGARKVAVIYFFHVTTGVIDEGEDTADGGANYRKLCPRGYKWKISYFSPSRQGRSSQGWSG